MRMRILLSFICTIIIYFSCQPALVKKRPQYDYDGMDSRTVEVHKLIEDFLFYVQETGYPIYVPASTRIEKINVSDEQKRIAVTLSEVFSQIPFREDNVFQTYQEMKKTLGDDFEDYSFYIITLNKPIEELIPNYYRSDKKKWDRQRMPNTSKMYPVPIVRKYDPDFIPKKGLYGKNIAVWHSHGWYYNNEQDRWMWQRPRLFGTVEDLLPLSFTIPYLVPMLENSGANVFIPRERDIQRHEIIVDNDSSVDSSFYTVNKTDAISWLVNPKGFSHISQKPQSLLNSFHSGTSLQTMSDTVASAFVEWRPVFAEEGYYAVYVTYPADSINCSDALYTVYHSAGKTSFMVNQQSGGSTWIYLGKFKFKQGYNPQNGKVVLSNKSHIPGRIVNADAVKFGGGMGDISRNGQSSRRPKFAEAARYYFQDTGIPDTLVYHLNDKDDYRDDLQSRGEWVNYLNGPPNGPNRNLSLGLNIPMEASLAFHTDAGISDNDTAIGTLQIYSLTSLDNKDIFPDSLSRYANRDLSDIVQTQVIDDIRQLFDPAWKRRRMYEGRYSEAVRPNVPSTMLELLSHQNFLDMKFALDPRFRFYTSRAVYKGLLRFISAQHQKICVVHPLPVSHFSAQFDPQGNIVLNWQPAQDPLEPTAIPMAYKVYSRLDDCGFDNGHLVKVTSYKVNNPVAGQIYSFKVTALNEGGESFPSEILSVCRMDTINPAVLIVNAFDRIGPPAVIDKNDFKGFMYSQDNGVPDKFDYNFTGDQFNFSLSDTFFSNDRPGYGASYADQESHIIAGNSFDFPFIHGQAIRKAGFSFISASDEAFTDNYLDLGNIKIIDLIMGEEKETGWQRAQMDSVIGKSFKTFPEKMKRAIRSYAAKGKSFFLSGSYIGTDLFKDKTDDYPDIIFGHNTLKLNWITDHAVKTGTVFTPVNSVLKLPASFTFNTEYKPDIYRVEAPDAIGPYTDSKTILRYRENGMSAGIAYEGGYKLVAFGFPFETILGKMDQSAVMHAILTFLSD